MASPYEDTILRIAPHVRGRYDPRHIEAYIRIEYGTLGHLSEDAWRREIEIAIGCIQTSGWDSSERAAKSFGL